MEIIDELRAKMKSTQMHDCLCTVSIDLCTCIILMHVLALAFIACSMNTGCSPFVKSFTCILLLFLTSPCVFCYCKLGMCSCCKQ